MAIRVTTALRMCKSSLPRLSGRGCMVSNEATMGTETEQIHEIAEAGAEETREFRIFGPP
jgi:hypothetical protein